MKIMQARGNYRVGARVEQTAARYAKKPKRAAAVWPPAKAAAPAKSKPVPVKPKPTTATAKPAPGPAKK
jgi:hypothetical protein